MITRPLRSLVGTVVAVTVLVSACGGDEQSDDEPTAGSDTAASDDGGSEAPSDGDGPFTGELETGVAASAELWVPPSDPDLADVEDWRERTGADPVTYGRVTLTNDTDEPDNGRFLTLTGPDGDILAEDRVEATFLCSEINNWWEESPDRDELVDEYATILDERCDGNFLGGPTVEPGATVEYWVTVSGDEPEFSRVYAGLGNELTR